MKLVFVRHGDPDYEHDTLTERGRKEAAALAEHIGYWKIDDIYRSPLGRASLTADYSIKKMGKDAITCDWLREFDADIDLNDHPDWFEAYPNCRKTEDGRFEKRICWDLVPSYMNKHPEYYENPGWREGEICTHSNILTKYDHVCEEFDKILASYGYVREGNCYRVDKENTKTVAFFCHLGVTGVILSHLMNTSPFCLWHGTCLAPTSVTLVRSEERQKGTALFRAGVIGDVSHLIMEDIEPSPAASFTEVYSDMEARH